MVFKVSVVNLILGRTYFEALVKIRTAMSYIKEPKLKFFDFRQKKHLDKMITDIIRLIHLTGVTVN